MESGPHVAPPRPLPRRTVVAGVAWATPVILTAVATPAVAASGAGGVLVTQVTACRLSQRPQDGTIYRFFLTFVNQGSQAAQIAVHTYPTFAGGSGPTTWTPPSPFTLAAGGTLVKVMYMGKNFNQPAPDGPFTLNFMVDSVATSSGPWPITNLNTDCAG